MPKPKLLGIEYGRLARPVRDGWLADLASAGPDARAARAHLRSLSTLEQRIATHPLVAGDPLERRHWPRCVARDYGEVPNLTRFELADRWRGFYSLVGQPGGVTVWILYLWDHPTYARMSGYAKK